MIRRTEAEISKRVHAALESEEFLQELQVRIDTAKKELTEKMLGMNLSSLACLGFEMITRPLVVL